MDSEDDTKDDVDSGNESSGDDVDFAMDVETHSTRERQTDLEEYPYEVLSTEEIVQHMVDCIKEVNTVVEVSMLVVNNGCLELGYSYVGNFNRFFCVRLEGYTIVVAKMAGKFRLQISRHHHFIIV